ncbi:hypothetical protein C823_006814 [Eubacterium plexicaudatum ASF492]|nr:hypothetical protein C823_006814 [Eubacterium plexicaudatum ASF492]
MSKKIRSDQEWLELIQECRASGLSVKNWCQTRSISIKTFYNKAADLRKSPVAYQDHRQLLLGRNTKWFLWKWLLIRCFIHRIPPVVQCRSRLPVLLSQSGYPDTVLKS